jgi:hypothetical protein
MDQSLSMQPQGSADAPAIPMVGKTDRKVFWSVMLAALVVLTFMTYLVSSGAVAMAASLPIPFTIQAAEIKGTDFMLYPGISQADNSTPVAVNTMNCTIASMVISKTLQVPVIGAVTVKFTAGSTTPATLNGLTTDVAALNADNASFGGMALTAGGHGLDQSASTVTLDNVTINSPYLMVNSITLPGLSVSIGQ